MVSSPVPAAEKPGSQARLLARWAAAGVLGAAAFAILRAVTPPPPEVLPFCLVRRYLGIPCPGCGMTRALSHLARGEWRATLALHPMAFLIAAELAFGWASAGLALLPRTKGLAERWLSRIPSVLVADAALLIALWAGRLASGTWPR